MLHYRQPTHICSGQVGSYRASCRQETGLGAMSAVSSTRVVGEASLSLNEHMWERGGSWKVGASTPHHFSDCLVSIDTLPSLHHCPPNQWPAVSGSSGGPAQAPSTPNLSQYSWEGLYSRGLCPLWLLYPALPPSGCEQQQGGGGETETPTLCIHSPWTQTRRTGGPTWWGVSAFSPPPLTAGCWLESQGSRAGDKSHIGQPG